ncbi:hypothetical protein K8R43_03460 [archaeon]|nr:hypothetical protein [archaeon]
MNNDTLFLLKRLGLNQYESRTYLSLVNSSPITATKLSDMAEIPRPRVYDVLSKLVKKGFAVTKPTRPTQYMAVPLNAAINSLKKDKIEEHEKNLEELKSLEAKLAIQFEDKFQEEMGQEDVYVIRGRKSIYSVLEDLIEKSDKHIILASNEEGMQRKQREYNGQLKKAKTRGVNVTMKHCKHRMVIVDDNALIFLSESKTPKTEEAAWIKSPFVATSMKQMLTQM